MKTRNPTGHKLLKVGNSMITVWDHADYTGDTSKPATTVRKGAVVLAGATFGRLEVMYRLGSANDGSGAVWRCRCECGGYAKVRTASLRNGSTRSCGCLLREYRRWQQGGENGAMLSTDIEPEKTDATYENALRAVDRLFSKYGETAVRQALREASHLRRLAEVTSRKEKDNGRKSAKR